MADSKNPYAGDSSANPYNVKPPTATPPGPGGPHAAPGMPPASDIAMPGQPPTSTKPRTKPNGAPADGSVGGGAPKGVQQGFASLDIPVICHGCGQRGIMPISAIRPGLRCVCGSDDMDADDEGGEDNDADDQASCTSCGWGGAYRGWACPNCGNRLHKKKRKQTAMKVALEISEPTATYSYQAHDINGQIITRTGLTWSQLCVQNGNLVMMGYIVTAKDNLGNIIEEIPPSWSVKKSVKQAVAKVGTGDGYYVVNRNIPIAGPYVTGSEARDVMVAEGGTVVEYRKATDPRGRTQNPDAPAKPLSLGTGHISSRDQSGKVMQIAQGIKATNPGMSTTAAFALAERTVERFPAVEGNA